MSAKATEVVPAPPPLSPAKAKKKSSSGWDRAKSKRRASTYFLYSRTFYILDNDEWLKSKVK